MPSSENCSNINNQTPPEIWGLLQIEDDMKLKFKDNTVRELPDNPKLAARLIYLSQQKGNSDYKLELDEKLPLKEKQKQLADIQHYVNQYRTLKRCGKEI